MRYYKVIDGNYIGGVASTSATTPVQNEISEQEYDAILAILKDAPEAPEGYDYRLKTDLTWELYELPPVQDDPASAEDYEAALARLGVNTDDQG